jgi:uncharacterized membrane protein
MPRIPLLIIALFFLTGGIAHFVYVDFFVLAMPDYLSYHEQLVMSSGIRRTTWNDAIASK